MRQLPNITGSPPPPLGPQDKDGAGGVGGQTLHLNMTSNSLGHGLGTYGWEPEVAFLMNASDCQISSSSILTLINVPILN